MCADRAYRRSEAFFGRRKIKALSKRQEGLFSTLLPKLVIDVTEPNLDPVNRLFPNKSAYVSLEIGFGAGEHLLHQSVTYPDRGFIGVEPFVNSMAKALSEVERKEIDNIRLYNEDAVELLDWLQPDCLDRIDILYPDPWPKKRHWKRRFINQPNLHRFAKVLKPGGYVNFACDITSYVNWTLQHFHKHAAFCWTAQTPMDWQNPFENWVQTRYESKAIREGRKSAYLSFQKIG